MSAIDDIAAYLASLETGGSSIGQIIFDELTPVVRCRDCKFCMSCWGADYCDYFKHVTNDPDGFCAWGERRDA